MPKCKCVVIGGTGFIGSYLCKELLKSGYVVTSFGRTHNALTDNLISNKSHFKEVLGDIRDSEALNKVVEGADYVFLFNSSSTPMTAQLSPFDDLNISVRDTLSVLVACVEQNVKRVVFASSGGSIYGNNHRAMHSENDVTKPASPYAIGKQTIENYLRYFKAEHGLDSITFRISNAYGVGQPTDKQQGLIAIFIDNISRGVPVTVFGDGSMVRDYIYVSDIARVVAQNFSSLDPQKEVYNLGSGVGHSINDIVSEIEKVSGKSFTVNYTPAPKTFVERIILDTSRIKQDVKDFQLLPLTDGISLMWEEYDNQR